MATYDLPAPDALRQLLRYEADTGRLFWLIRPPTMFKSDMNARRWNTRFAGKEAFTATDKHGYKVGRLGSVGLKAHRVIWAIVHDEWPAHDIDHINGSRADNRIDNLRHATRAENMRNKAVDTKNASGTPGVRKSGGRWIARISHLNRGVHLGCFLTEEEAVAARLAAAADLGYHPNHGRPVTSRQDQEP